jgi:bacteriocin-like protein
MGSAREMRLDENAPPKEGTTAEKWSWEPKDNTLGWVGVYYQYPPNNWGTRPSPYNLNGYKKLTFWAKGEKGGEVINEFKVGGIMGDYSDSDTAGIGPITLTKIWKQYEIELTDRELSQIIGGFAFALNLDGNPNGATFYLDEIRYEE